MIALSNFSIIKRLYTQYLRKYKRKLVLAGICMVVAALTNTMQISIIEPIVNKVFTERKFGSLYYITVGLFLISLIRGIASYYQSTLVKSVGQRMISNMQIELYHKLIYADLELLDQYSSGKLISRFTNDINMMRNSVAYIFTAITKDFLTVIFLVLLMFYQNWRLAIIASLIFPLAIMPVTRLSRKLRRISYQTQNELSNYTGKLDDTFQNIRVVKSYLREGFEITRANKTIEEIYRLSAKAIRAESLASPIMEILTGITIALVVLFGGTQVLNGEIDSGSFLTAIGAILMAYRPVKSLAEVNTKMQEGLTAAERLFNLLDSPEKRQQSLPNLKVINGDIVFEQVNFSYHQTPVLNAVSLEIKGGTTVAFVGSSGGGKSTFINLLLRFYDSASGRIFIDGQDIMACDKVSVRQNIALVTQEIVLFDDTIKANIAYGNLDASEEEIMNAAKIAAAHQFIVKLPDGYETHIGPKGFKLSGGQRQRIAIARAILKNSPILLLDEATAALDTISEAEIQESISRLHHQKTIIIVAHRLSTVINADQIFVMDKGRIVESGSHQGLLSFGGVYSKLYRQQAQES